MICFSLLAHKDEQALLKQIKNIRKYTRKDAKIVLYNGGTNKNFGKSICKQEDVLYCPYSRPLEPRKTGRCFYDIMQWLEEATISYEYLVYTEYDVMFINQGFVPFIQKKMKDYDCLVKLLRHETNPDQAVWIPAKRMWEKWEHWKPFFKQDSFYGTSNPMQVYRHEIIKNMIAGIDKEHLEKLFRSNASIGHLGEMLYITLAMRSGAKCQTYPEMIKEHLRYRPAFTLEEAKAAKSSPEVMFLHPVKDAPVRDWICEQ
ncbi:hypothetical protein [Paenibacillus sp. GP183]|uniref:hypothetical protein n=1 Tax=Paenibacillus sp. GP183 TaxID=1882751 RepID=UPI00089AF7EB|nr:hypothetical protein [Paenibacillus sp. GP183]SEC69743.1 hypothetical protein SAMN05443246_5037 [Paenibacillus sp. GP183]